MKKQKSTNQFSWYQYQGLPIAALSLVVLLLVLLFAVRTINSQNEQADQQVQGVFTDRMKAAQKNPTQDAALIDRSMMQIDAVVSAPTP